jgi:quercetin dioxygenase-like cupin family protein
VKPYIDEKISEHSWTRTFDPNVSDSEEYIWHRDTEDRTVTVLEGNGWKFQLDNQLPKYINTNDTVLIPKMVYHRIIPCDSVLKILIKEDKFQ